jgi:hypothetical protein
MAVAVGFCSQHQKSSTRPPVLIALRERCRTFVRPTDSPTPNPEIVFLRVSVRYLTASIPSRAGQKRNPKLGGGFDDRECGTLDPRVVVSGEVCATDSLLVDQC